MCSQHHDPDLLKLRRIAKMKKTLLTAALMAGFVGFGGMAQAETSVTLYGLVDGGISYQRVKGTNPATGEDYRGTKTGFLSGGESDNRWGLRGTEDLGDGLQAVFVLENGFDLGTGTTSQYNNRFFGRQATIGLQSNAWGRLDFGRQSNIAYKYLSDVISPFGHDFSQARSGATVSATDNVRFDNMIMYQTPTYAGFQFGVGYSFNNSGNQQFKLSGNSEPNSRAWTTGLRYTNGPIAAALTYDQIKSASTFGDPADNGVNINTWNIGGSYDFNVVKLHVGFGQTRNGWFAPIQYATLGGQTYTNSGNATGFYADSGLRVNSYTVGLSAPVGVNGEIMASWGMADPRDGGVHTDLLGTHKQSIYSLGYTYALSKRTNLYAIGSYGTHVEFANDLNSTFVGAGIRHQF
jgi:predicted porin